MLSWRHHLIPWTPLFLLGSTPKTFPRQNCRRLDSLPVVKLVKSFNMSTRAEPTRPILIPQPSASLVVVNKRNEVLLVHRNPQARSYGGVHVGFSYCAQLVNASTVIEGLSGRKR